MERGSWRGGGQSRDPAVAAVGGLLALSRLTLRQPPLPELLAAVARVVSESTGFSTVVINAYQAADDSYEVLAVYGSERARRILHGNVTAGSTWEPLLDARFERHGAYFIAAGQVEYDSALDWYTPELPAGEPGDAAEWHPDDALFAPIEGPGGGRYGVISVDDPVSGSRPDDRQLEVLGALAAHAAVAIESARQLRALEGAVQRHRAVLDSALDCVVAIDARGRVLEFNPAAERTFGYRAADVIGRELAELIIPAATRDRHRQAIAHGVRSGEWRLIGQRLELVAMRADGSELAVELSLAEPQRDEHGEMVFYGFVRDISERRRGEEQLTYMAYHDALTALPNRILAEEQTELALARARRSGGSAALMFVDLDGFKEVNDELGHAAGDRLLTGVAARLRSVLRDSDLLARQGGDEFLVLLADLPADAAGAVEQVGDKLLDALREPFELLGRRLRTGASIGVSMYPSDAEDTQTLLRHADGAMYVAKAAGGGRLAFHHTADAPLSHRAGLASQLRRAMARDELRLHFQPVWSIGDERGIAGVEALLRWEHPERGLLRPDAFMDTAERSLAGDELSLWQLQTLCAHARRWADDGLQPIVGFNVSPRQLAPGFAAVVLEQLNAHGLEPGRFVAEVSESSWTVDGGIALSTIAELRAGGVAIALDDFGSGYCTLSRLRRLQLDVIKLDGSLLAGVPANATSVQLLRAAVGLAAACEAPVVANGVENHEQVTLLHSLGVRFAQGFLLGHPVSAQRLATLYRRHRIAVAPPAHGVRAPYVASGVMPETFG